MAIKARPSAEQLENTLRRWRLPALDGLLPADFVLPCYDGLSLANLPATLAALLGGELPGTEPPLPRHLWGDWAPSLRRVVVVMLDAVGYLHLRAALDSESESALARLRDKGRLIPVTSVFPSTTSVALCTLWTGQAPAAHGMMGFQMYLRRYGTVANMLTFSPVPGNRQETLVDWGLEPETFLPVPSLGEMLARQGVATRALVARHYARSSLSRIILRGVTEVQGFVAASDMWLNLHRTLAQHLDERLLLVTYWGGPDALGHVYGPDDEAWRAELRALSFGLEHEFLARLSPAEREGTLLLIISDHGQITTPLGQAVRLLDQPTLQDGLLMPPSGDARAAYFYTWAHRTAKVRQYIEQHLSRQLVVIDSKTALTGGLFGAGGITPEARTRIGDTIVIARGNAALLRGDEEDSILGRHGGLTADEMLIPLLGTRLDDFEL